jgi:hypothetical protein
VGARRQAADVESKRARARTRTHTWNSDNTWKRLHFCGDVGGCGISVTLPPCTRSRAPGRSAAHGPDRPRSPLAGGPDTAGNGCCTCALCRECRNNQAPVCACRVMAVQERPCTLRATRTKQLVDAARFSEDVLGARGRTATPCASGTRRSSILLFPRVRNTRRLDARAACGREGARCV